MNNERNLGFAELISETDRFIRQNFLTTFVPGLISGLCRFVQEGGAGPVSVSTQAILGIVVFLSRTIIVLSAAGQGNIVEGLNQIFKIFSLSAGEWKMVGMSLKENVRFNLPALIVNVIVFVVISIGVNVGLAFLMEATPFLTHLKSLHLLAPTAGQWPVILFLKNISIIPFAFVFEILLVMFLTGAVKFKFL